MFLSDVETDVWPPGLVNELASRSARWLITRGEFGADEVVGNSTVHLPPEKVCLDLMVPEKASSLDSMKG